MPKSFSLTENTPCEGGETSLLRQVNFSQDSSAIFRGVEKGRPC